MYSQMLPANTRNIPARTFGMNQTLTSCRAVPTSSPRSRHLNRRSQEVLGICLFMLVSGHLNQIFLVDVQTGDTQIAGIRSASLVNPAVARLLVGDVAEGPGLHLVKVRVSGIGPVGDV